MVFYELVVQVEGLFIPGVSVSVHEDQHLRDGEDEEGPGGRVGVDQIEHK